MTERAAAYGCNERGDAKVVVCLACGRFHTHYLFHPCLHSDARELTVADEVDREEGTDTATRYRVGSEWREIEQ